MVRCLNAICQTTAGCICGHTNPVPFYTGDVIVTDSRRRHVGGLLDFQNDMEAHAVLDLIVAEFNSDPMSVQCFDASIVERAKACVLKRKQLMGGA